MFGESNVGLLFTIKAEDKASEVISKLSRNVQSETSAIGTKGSAELDKLTGSSGRLGGAFAALASPAALAATAVVAIGAAGITAAVGLFNLAKSASDFGSEINDASEKTGLSAKSISSLKFAADQSGSSLGEISISVAKFSRLIGEAAQGSEEATTSLTRFGIDPKKAVNDLDGALSTVIKTIYELPPGVQQATAAHEAFGRSGSDLIPVINATKGDFAAFTKEAEKLGVVLSQEDAKAADEFGDTLDTLKAQAAGAAFQFAKEFMPQIVKAMREVSRILIDNKETLKTWGEATGTIITAATRVIRGLENAWLLARAAAQLYATGVPTVPAQLLQPPERVVDPLAGISIDPNSNSRFTTDLDAAEDAKKAAEKARQEREKAQKEQLTADEKFNKASTDRFIQGYDELQRVVKDNYEKQLITGETFRAQSIANEEEYTKRLIALKSQEFDSQRAQETNKTARQALNIQETTELEKIREASRLRIAAIEKDITSDAKEASDERVKISEDEAERLVRINKLKTERSLSDLEANHKLLNTSEKQYQKEREDLIFQSLKYEEKLYQELVKNPLLSPESKSGIQERLRAISNEINKGFNEATIRNVESFGKAVKTVDDLLKDFGVGTKTGLEELNVLLADPEVTEAIKRRAESIGYTTEQLKELLRVQQEGKDKGLTTGTRERVVDDGLSKAATEQAGKGIAGGVASTLGGLFGGGVDPENKIKDQAEYMKAVHADLAESAKAAIGSMVQGLGQLAAQWIATGKFSAKAALQMVSGIATGLAIEAGLKALMEYATGLAMAANPFTAGLAGAHFAAATAYGVTAAAAAAVGVGSGLASRAFGGGTGSGSASSSAFKQSTANNSLSETRTSREKEERVITEEERNQRNEATAAHNRQQVIRHEHYVTLDRGLIVREVGDNIRNRGDLHGLVIRTAEG